MSGQMRAELLKLRTRTTLWLVTGTLAVVLLAVLAQGFSESPAELALEDHQRALFQSASMAGLLAALVGLLSVTTEFRYGTIRSTLLVEPRRRRMLAAKLAVASLAGLTGAAIVIAAGDGAAAIVLHTRGVARAVPGGDVVAVAAGIAGASVLWALLGVALGALLRSQVGAILALLAWNMIVESIVFGLLPSVGRYLPGEAGNALSGATAAHLLSQAGGGLVMLAWALAAALAAAVRTDRTDVP